MEHHPGRHVKSPCRPWLELVSFSPVATLARAWLVEIPPPSGEGSYARQSVEAKIKISFFQLPPSGEGSYNYELVELK